MKKKQKANGLVWCGIRFRAASHLEWFVLSIVIFVVAVYVSVSQHDRISIIIGQSFFCGTAVMAAIATKVGRQETQIYSRDCIWWNGLLGLILLILDRLFLVGKL